MDQGEDSTRKKRKDIFAPKRKSIFEPDEPSTLPDMPDVNPDLSKILDQEDCGCFGK